MGGQAGQVGFPAYLEEFHDEVLTGSAAPSLSSDVQTVMNSLFSGGNPYTGVASYNPDEALQLSQDSVNRFVSTVKGIRETSTWNRFVDVVMGRINEILPSANDIDEDVQAFDVQSMGDLARSYNRVTAGFRDINAVVSTAFPTALALLENDHNNQVARYRTERMLQRNRERALVFIQSVEQIYKIMALRMTGEMNLVSAQDGVSRFKIGAKMDQIRGDVGFQHDETMWDLSILQEGAGVIGAMSGIPPVSKKLSPLQSIVSGALTGLTFGMQAGIATGSFEIGAIGALVGAVGGGFLGAATA